MDHFDGALRLPCSIWTVALFCSVCGSLACFAVKPMPSSEIGGFLDVIDVEVWVYLDLLGRPSVLKPGD